MATEFTPEDSFNALKANTVEAIKAYFPYEGRKNKLVLEDVRVDDNQSSDDINSQLEAKEKMSTWGVPVKATAKLLDKITGKVIDEKKNVTLARLPKLTNRYGYIVGGNEYQVDHLFRLKSGAYTRIQQNGELETEFNLSKSPTGRGFSIHFDPKKQRFNFRYGTSNIPIYPIMKAMGVSDDALEHSWGKAILEANKISDPKKSETVLSKFWDKINEGPIPTDHEELANGVAKFFEGTEIFPDTTKITMGKPFTTVNGEALLIGSSKALGVSRGTHKPDDRDSLAFKTVDTIEDFIPGKIKRSFRNIKGKIRSTVDLKDSISEILNPDLFNKPIHEFFRCSISERSEQTNPVQMLSANRKTTLMAKDLGGMKSEHQITQEMHVVNPSHFGFLDALHTPECHDDKTEVFTKSGWIPWTSVTDKTLLACREKDSNRLLFFEPIELYAKQYKGKMYGMNCGKAEYLVTPNHRILSKPLFGNSWRIDNAENMHGKHRKFSVGHEPFVDTKNEEEYFYLPFVDGDSKTQNIEKILMTDWAEFMGWFLSEGSCTYKGKDNIPIYSVSISQNKSANPDCYERIESLLKRLPFGDWTYDKEVGFKIGRKQLSHYLSQFGYCYEKFIPEYLFSESLESRENLLESLLLGDGRTFSNRKPDAKYKSYKQRVFTTSSEKLAEEIGRAHV